MTEPAQPITITIKRAVELSGLSQPTLYRRMADGSLEAVKVGGRTLIKYRSLRTMLGEAA